MTAGVPVAARWFERTTIDDAITLLVEPHVVPLMRCNIWHVRGRDRDLLIDSGMGVASLVAALAEVTAITERPLTALATHGHDDHIGGFHEIARLDHAELVAHRAEAHLLADPPLATLDPVAAWGADVIAAIEAAGCAVSDPYFVTALPSGVALETFRHHPARVTRLVDEGDVIDTGDRRFEVLHLPGHSPGSIGLWEAATGTLFSGDAIYDGPLLDELAGSDVAAYCRTMERLLTLPVRVVHAGHDPSFGGERLRELARDYLARRNP